MTCAFERLGLEARPRIDPERLKQNYHSAAAAAHPDRNQGDASALAALNAARALLESVPSRLRHLAGRLPAAEPSLPEPGMDWDLSLNCGAFARKVREWAAKDRSTALQRALGQAEALTLQKDAEALMRDLSRRMEKMEQSLSLLDERWPAVGANELTNLADQWTFHARMHSTLQESLTLLRGG